MIVVDTNLLVYLAVGGADTGELAAAVVERDAAWLAPPLWRSEFRNTLAGYVRRGLLDVEQSLKALDHAEAHLIAEVDPRSDAVMSLVVSSGCTAYDLEFVAVAQSLGAMLVTSDAQVLAAFPVVAVHPREFVAPN